MFRFKKNSPITAAIPNPTRPNRDKTTWNPHTGSSFGMARCFIFSCAIVLAACSSDTNSIANGTGSQAGETELAISFVKADGSPLARAIARTWKLSETSMELISADTLNDEGKIKLDTNLSGLYLVDARSGDSLSAMDWINFGKSTSQTPHVASANVSLKGAILQNGTALSNASIQILDKKVVTDNNGEFEFTGLPEGFHFAVVESDKGSLVYQLQATADSSVNSNLIDLDTDPFILVDNFEQWNTRRTILGRTFGEGWWFELTDEMLGGGSTILNGDNYENYFVEEAEKGYVMHLNFDLDENTDGRYGVAGFALGDDFEKHENYAFFDLSESSAISFDAKGSGELFLQLTLRDSTGEKLYTKSAPIELSGEWQRYTITTKELDSDLTAVNSINFVVENDAELYLDDIKIEGISIGMWPSLGRNF